MDVLSDVLLAVHLEGAVFFDITARSPFVAQSPPTEVIAARVATDAEHLIAFHVITAGSCWVEAVEEPEGPVLLEAGQMVIFPSGEGNILGLVARDAGQPDLPLYYRPVSEALPFAIDINGDSSAEECRIVCGYFACDTRPFNPLLESLPRMGCPGVGRRLVGMDERSAGRRDPGEQRPRRRAGGHAGQAVRAHAARGASRPHRWAAARARNWVAGLRDPEIGSTLRLIHGRYAEPWTLGNWPASAHVALVLR